MTIRSANPHQPTDLIHEFEPSGPDEVDAVIQRARHALDGWRDEPAIARGSALSQIATDLEARAEEVSRLVVREVGKPITEARAEVSRCVAIWRYYSQVVLAADGSTYPAADARSLLMARRYPLGVCALITPWNFPSAIPTWKCAPAVAYGNVAILKPASAATATGRLLVEIAANHLPEGVLQLLPGDARTGEFLVDHPDIAAVSFTGSGDVGRMIAQGAAARGIRAQCEMGGQNPSLVLADADIGRAASTIAYASMGYAGQKCTATSRIIVEGSVYVDMRDQLVAAVEAMQVEDPSRDDCQVGPMITEDARLSATEAIQQSGGRLLTGGNLPDSDGFYLAPSLVELSDPTDILAQEEVFGPVAALLRAASPEEAVRVANDVRYGLVAAVFTRDLESALTLTGNLEAGLTRVNAPTSGVDFHAPFGGAKASSLGPREQGFAARDFYTETRTLLMTP